LLKAIITVINYSYYCRDSFGDKPSFWDRAVEFWAKLVQDPHPQDTALKIIVGHNFVKKSNLN